MSLKLLFGFHAVTVRLKVAPKSIRELHVDATRRDQRMKQFLGKAEEAGLKVIESDDDKLQKMCGTHRHQGVVARVEVLQTTHSLDDLLDGLTEPALLLVLDGITDPHNLGACLRTADAMGVHAVIAPKDKSAGLNATVSKVACGAAETVPYITVTNLARTLRELKEYGIWIVGTDMSGEADLFHCALPESVAWVMGNEGEGMRRLTREHCDLLVSIPMFGTVESMNVSVSAGMVLSETRRQRTLKTEQV